MVPTLSTTATVNPESAKAIAALRSIANRRPAGSEWRPLPGTLAGGDTVAHEHDDDERSRYRCGNP